jgi:hypothetical protein
MQVKIPYHSSARNTIPQAGAVKFSSILKTAYNLEFAKDYTWHFDSPNKYLIISLAPQHDHLATMISLKYASVDLYDLAQES